MVLKMSSDKSPIDSPTYIITADPTSNEKMRPMSQRKKLVILAVTAIIVVGLITTAVLVGIYLVKQADKEIASITFSFRDKDNEDTKQTSLMDPNDNVVSFHVTKNEQDVWIVNDMNRGIQTVRVQSSSGTTCYVTPLNQSEAMTPAVLSPPDMRTASNALSQPFLLSNTPVVDRSFMTKKAVDLCSGVSVYWAYRSCGEKTADKNLTTTGDRQKRAVTCGTYHGLPSLGCNCRCYFACGIQCYEYYTSGVYHCDCYVSTGNCCGQVVPPGTTPVQPPYCNNWYYYAYC